MFASKTPWILLLIIWMAGSTWWHVCKIKQLCADDAQPAADVTSAEETSSPDVAPNGLTIADGASFRLVFPGNFSFARSSANANMEGLGNSLDSLTAYLKANQVTSMPGKSMTITGYYMPDETNGTSFANVGLARAEAVKQYFVQQGVEAESLITKGEVRSGTDGNSDLVRNSKGDLLYGGIGFAFGGAEPVATPTADTTQAPSASTTAPVTEDGLAAAEKFTSVFKPIDLYFRLAGSSFIRTPETTKFFDEAAKYLATHKDKKLVLTGHTDNSGPDATNLELSRRRANGVKSRLRRSGIRQEQIVVEAKGEATPKASNDTREGRKANRRVTVVVQ